MCKDATVYMTRGMGHVSRPYHESVTECGVAACERIAPARTEISDLASVQSHRVFALVVTRRRLRSIGVRSHRDSNFCGAVWPCKRC